MKKRRVRTAALLAGVAAFAAGTLAIPPPAFAAAAKLKLTMWGNATHMPALQPIIDEFNASQNRIEVEVIHKEPTPDPILAAYLAGELPDIIESGGVFIHQYAPQGLMAELDPFVKAEGANFMRDFFPATIATDNTVNGRLYGLPIFTQIEGGYYNPTVLADSGVPAPQAGWTWDDLRALARKSRRYGPDGNKQTWGIIARHPLQFDYVLLGQAGGTFITPDNQVTINSSPVRETYNWILGMIDEDLLRYRGIHSDAGDDVAWGHKAAYVADATYRQNTWDQLQSPLTTAPPLRRSPGSEPTTIMTDRGLAIMNVSPERQAAAWEVMKYLLRPENVTRFLTTLGYPPATRSAAQSRVFQEYARRHPNMMIWADQYLPLRNVRPWPYPMSHVQTPLVTASQALQAKKIPLEQFIADMDAQLKQLVKERLEGK